ncbi:MAG: MBG domain-containing protein, partial [Collinsella sp.]
MTPDARGEFTVQNAESDLVVTVEGVRKHEAVSDKWVSDDGAHWHKCACGDKIDEAAHTFTWVVDKAPTATEVGSSISSAWSVDMRCLQSRFRLPPSLATPTSDGDYHTVDASSLPKGATAQYSTDGKTWSPEAPKIKDVGTLEVAYQVTIDGVKAEGEVTLEVKPRAITVTAQDASKTYGEADPVFTRAITSGELVEGEALQGLEIEREDNDNVRDGG